MQCKVFYSWQSDLPNALNRSFIEQALFKAAKSIRSDESVQVEPVVDRDTADIPGAPDIARAILQKIDEASVFVCDVSIINREEDRPAPNPNVLIELGYALKRLGESRIIMVMNKTFGGPELLPFDLRMKRVCTYEVSDSTQDRASARTLLEKALLKGLQGILVDIRIQEPSVDMETPLSKAIEAVEEAKSTQEISVRKFIGWLLNEHQVLASSLSGDGEPDDLLLEAMNQSQTAIAEYARLAESVALANSPQAALTMYKGLESVVARYNPPRGFSGPYPQVDLDFYRFVGHELFVTLFSFLIRENRWELIADLLGEQLYVDNPKQGTPQSVSFHYVSEFMPLLEHRNERLQHNAYSLRANVLHDRHTKGKLAEMIPEEQFIDADYFLFLRSVVRGEELEYRYIWRAWSTLFIGSRIPRYLVEAQHAKYAQQLVHALGVEELDTLRARLSERAPILRQLFRSCLHFQPLEDFNFTTIGTKD